MSYGGLGLGLAEGASAVPEKKAAEAWIGKMLEGRKAEVVLPSPPQKPEWHGIVARWAA